MKGVIWVDGAHEPESARFFLFLFLLKQGI